jgi:hypothetical protein
LVAAKLIAQPQVMAQIWESVGDEFGAAGSSTL